MTQHRLSYAKVNLICDCIVELIIDEGIVLSIEMLDEFDEFLALHVNRNFALLVNRVNKYQFSYEVKFLLASQEGLCGIAVVTYNAHDTNLINDFKSLRSIDDLNLKVFEGLELGWQTGLDWLIDEVNQVETCCCD